MQCPHCRFDNPESMKFCGSCGSKLEMVCPQCNFANPVNFKFCGVCGHDLKSLTKPSSIDYDRPQTYTPKFLADKILTNRGAIEGERKLVTVLFADVANYTAMAEKLDPEEVHAIMDGCFKILMDEIHKYEGTINQFTGDGVMALFGAPVAHEDHAQRACYATLAIRQAISEYNEKIKREYDTAFEMRMGLNSGPVIVGAIGDDLRMDYTAVGDTTNLAARMEDLAEPGTILVSQHTYRLARDFFELEGVGDVVLKGKAEAQPAYRLLQASDVKTRISASVSKGLTRFVGRRREMTILREAFDKAAAGSGQVVGISGEAGVGKSRLLIELRTMLSSGHYTYLEGRCLHYGGAMPYLPLLDILRSYFGIKEGEREAIIRKNMTDKVLALDENLKPVLAPFQDLLSLKVQDEAYLKLEPRRKRERTFEALRDLFIRLSQDRPLVLAVEDLHWIDQTSQAFLDYLIGWLANAPILLLVLYRPEYTHTWGSKSYYTKIGVNQLSTGTSAELVQSILEGAKVAPELRDLILNRTAGIPLFMEEFTHSLIENGTIEKTDNRYVLSSKAASISIPDTIEGIIAARIDRLEENLKRTMQVASVIGREFAFRILHTITGMKEDLKSYLINLQGLEFIYEKSLFPELEYIFKHILTQEVAYNSLLVRRRKEIHENIGRAIEEVYPERLEEFYEMLAYHYLKAENFEKAAHYLNLSGIKATSIHAPREAFHYFTEALGAMKRLPQTDENKRSQIEVSLLMYPARMYLGQPEGSLQILQAGARLSEELGDQRSLMTFYSNLAFYYHQIGDPLPGVGYGEKAYALAGKMYDTRLVAATAFDLYNVYMNLGEYKKIFSICTHVIDLLEKENMQTDFCGRPFAMYPIACAYRGVGSGMLGDFENGGVFCEKALQTATALGDQRTLALVEVWYGFFYHFKGDGNLALNHSLNGLRYCQGMKFTMLAHVASCFVGGSYLQIGQHVIARQFLEEGIAMAKDIRVEVASSYWHRLLSEVHSELGDYEIALGLIEKAVELARKTHEKANEGVCKIWWGRISAKSAPLQRRQAEESIRTGIQILEQLKLRPAYADGYLALGELYAETGETEKALENLRIAEQMYTEMRMDYYLTKTRQVLKML
jgi:class 3 adenylate cyclase/tetratricopeptide (TPR) repeat protein